MDNGKHLELHLMQWGQFQTELKVDLYLYQDAKIRDTRTEGFKSVQDF